MRKQLIAASIRKVVLASLALATLTTVVLLHAAEPAAARKPKKETCGDKYGACTSRCIRNNDTTEGAFRCVTRTCDHQFDACIADKGGDDSSGKVGLPKRPAIGPGGTGGKVTVTPKPTIGPRGPLSGGILDAGQGIPSQGPATAGSPRAPAGPSAPPVIIR